MSKFPASATTFTSVKIQAPGSAAEAAQGNGVLYLEPMTTAQQDALSYAADPNKAGGINGAILYNNIDGFYFGQNDTWTPLQGGGVNGITFTGTRSAVDKGDVLVFSNSGVGDLATYSTMNVDSINGNVSINGAVGNLTVKGTITSQDAVLEGSLQINGSNLTHTIPANSDYYSIDNKDGSNWTDNSVDDSKEPFTLNNVAILCNGSLVTRAIYAYNAPTVASSINIKNILDSQDIGQEALDKFMQLPFKKYEYKDKIKYRSGVTYGLIAEELKTVMPEAIINNKDYLANVMLPVDLINTKKTGKDIYLSKLSLKDKSIALNTKLVIGDKIEVLSDTSHKCVIKDVNSDSISVESDSPFNGDKIFLYGTYGDCPGIIKEGVFELGLVTLRKVIDIIESQGKEIEALRLQVNKI